VDEVHQRIRATVSTQVCSGMNHSEYKSF
jgi:hypothetical protein